MSKIIHLKGLNGIRAIAAIAVVISHINLGLAEFNLSPTGSIDLAGHGVTIFFALSGFLITYLLLHEKRKQEIAIAKFYLRRILRIWPLYFLYLIIAISIAYYYNKINSIFPPSLYFYFFFAANIPFIYGGSLPFLHGLWSIGVEEQFYLFWPWIIKRRKRVLQAVSIFAIAFFLLRLTCRFIEYKWHYSSPYLAIQVNRFDCMAIGAVGAILFYNENKSFVKIVTLKVVQLVSWLSIFLMAFNKFHIASVIDPEIVSVITVIIIINVSSNKKSLIKLDSAVFDFLGKISYGIYVIHPLIIFLWGRVLNEIILPEVIKYILAYLGVVVFTVLISYLSFEFFEKRFIKLKDNFSIIRSSGFKIS